MLFPIFIRPEGVRLLSFGAGVVLRWRVRGGRVLLAKDFNMVFEEGTVDAV